MPRMQHNFLIFWGDSSQCVIVYTLYIYKLINGLLPKQQQKLTRAEKIHQSNYQLKSTKIKWHLNRFVLIDSSFSIKWKLISKFNKRVKDLDLPLQLNSNSKSKKSNRFFTPGARDDIENDMAWHGLGMDIIQNKMHIKSATVNWPTDLYANAVNA